ncbi:hypothetical protein [Streptosporangium sp. NPDC087985]|uniref:hypothetical protein n=1 Tax=Streptosporangium sp. NPDC087985 TaxID=3366196 RepID=UPI003815693D
MHDLPVWIPLAVSAFNLATAIVDWVTARTRHSSQAPTGRTPDKPSAGEHTSPAGR